jgi:tRNA uridine 5-carboxymethylaminomethyl modification enzyme
MFTSRAEHRLLFNHGSAELRLLGHAIQHNLLTTNRIDRIRDKKDRVSRWTILLETLRYKGDTYAEHVRRAGKGAELPVDFAAESEQVRDEVLYRVGYKGYLEREERQIEKLSHIERIRIPAELDFAAVRGLRRESALKLASVRPSTLGQASRISGVNPSDVNILMVVIESGRGEAGKTTRGTS